MCSSFPRRALNPAPLGRMTILSKDLASFCFNVPGALIPQYPPLKSFKGTSACEDLLSFPILNDW